MGVYPPPLGPVLTSEQARQLDDTFLASDPFEYFRSRIGSLLAWHERAVAPDNEPPGEGTIRAEFNAYLQRDAAKGPFKDLDVYAQVATDALSVRHHAAESLLRLACARLVPSEAASVGCLWGEIAGGPQQIVDVIGRLREGAASPDAGERLFHSVVPPEFREEARSNADVVDAANVYGEWLAYAGRLLSPAEIDFQAAHNKVKHGLAVRARADLKITFTTTPPNEDGSVPLSALTGAGAIDIFDQPVVELLASPKVDGHGQGLELTQLRLNPAALLAEAYMLATAHGAMFHVAAIEHFADRADLPDHLAPPTCPDLPVGGPRPADIDSASPLGMRFPLTTPPAGGPGKRLAGIGFREYFQIIHMSYAERTSRQVVDG